MTRRFLAMLLAAVMLLGAAPATALISNAELSYTGSGTVGNPWVIGDCSVTLIDGVLTVSGTGMLGNTGAGKTEYPWYSVKDSVTSVIVTEGVTGLGREPFMDCTNLVSVDLAASVAYVGEGSFAYGYNTKAVRVRGVVTSIGSVVFYGTHPIIFFDVMTSEQVMAMYNTNTFYNDAILEGYYNGLPEASYTLKNGVICFTSTPRKSVTTDLRSYNNRGQDLAIDGDPSTYFWAYNSTSNDGPRAGSCITVDLGQIVEAPGVSLKMGVPDHSADYIKDGVIECSTDGVTYTKLCDLDGTNTIETHTPFTARYLRLRITANQSTWATVAEFGVVEKSASTDLSVWDNHGPKYAIDGDPSTYFYAHNGSYGGPDAGSTFTVDLGAVFEASGVELSMGAPGHENDYIRAGVIEYSSDGENYTELCSLDGSKTLTSDESFTARYVRLRCTESQNDWATIIEFDVKTASADPSAPAGQTAPAEQPCRIGTTNGSQESYPWNSSRSSITKAVVGDGVVIVGKNAFNSCGNLTEIELSSSVRQIGGKAFANCSQLRDVTLAGTPRIAENAFSNASALTNVYSCHVRTELTTSSSGNDAFNNANFFTHGDAGFKYEARNVVAPTCTRSGYTSCVCSLCGAKTQYDFVDPVGHNYENGVCTRCGLHMPGDVNGDNVVTIADVTALLNYLSGNTSAAANGYADLNDDGEANIIDVSKLLNYLSGEPWDESDAPPDAADRAFLAGFSYPDYSIGEENSVYYLGRWFEKEIDGIPHMVTVTCGSQIFLLTENTTHVYLDFTVITQQDTPRIAVSIDGGPITRQMITERTVTLPDSGRHILRIYADGMVQSEGRWSEIGFALREVSVDEGGRMRAVKPNNKVIFFYGDSITEGICALAGSNTSTYNSASTAYPNVCAAELNAIPYYIGYSGSGVTVVGSFNVFAEAIEKYSETRAADFSVIPDLIAVNHGTNDGLAGVTSGVFTAELRTCIDKLTAHYPGVQIVYMVPFGRMEETEIASVAADYANVSVVLTSGWGVTYSDGIHPNAEGAKNAGERLAEAILNIVGEDFFANTEPARNILDEAYALNSGETLGAAGETFTLSGTVVSVDEAYNANDGTVTVTMAVTGDEAQRTVRCVGLTGSVVSDVVVGSHITVTGRIANDSGVVCFRRGCKLAVEKLNVSVQPTPLSATVSDNAVLAASADLLTPSVNAYDAVFTRFGFAVGEGGLPVAVTTDPSLEEEEYALTVALNGVSITAAGDRGVYYAIATLAQLRSGDLIAAAQIEDKPAVPLRGVIEGFYGPAWSHQCRLDLFRYMGKYKLNTYIYAPKDDAKHRGSWRALYTADELIIMRQLVSCATENNVHFVYAISPGLDFDFENDYDGDLMNLINKCQQLYDLGVRDFAIFLDDIGSRDAAGHAQMLNDFQEQFIKTHAGCSDLIAITPEYFWDYVGTYTYTFAANIDPDILLMWTGNGVLPPSIEASDLTEINGIYGRKVFIWWNYPCNDFSDNSLYTGPCVNLDVNLPGSISGLVSNPMNQGYASMLPMLTISDYLWNPTSYDPETSIRSACEHLAPGWSEGLYDLMDLTRDAQINDATTAWQLRDLVAAFGRGEEGAAEELRQALGRMSEELTVLAEKGDPRLLNEIEPWVTKARAYVDAACAIVDFYMAEDDAARGEAAMRCVNAYRKSAGSPAFISGDLLEPFVKKGKAEMIFSTKSASTDMIPYLANVADNAIDGNLSTFFWSDTTPKAGNYFTVDLGKITEVPGVSLQMSVSNHPTDYITDGVIEYSIDGVTYTKLCDLDGSTSLETDTPFTARYLRLRVTANQAHWAIIAEFGVKNTSQQPSKSASTDLTVWDNHGPDLAIDGDPATYFYAHNGSLGGPAAGSTFTVDLGAVLEVSGIGLTMGAEGHADDYIRKGVIEYSTDGGNYTVLCSLNGSKTLTNDSTFTARYVRLRCTESQSYWAIISEFTVRCATDLPEGFSFEGSASCDFSPLFNSDLFTTFSPNPAVVSGCKLYIDLTDVSSVELYLASATGLRVYTVDGGGNAGADIPLAPYMAPDLTGAARLCIEFTSERTDIAEIVIG